MSKHLQKLRKISENARQEKYKNKFIPIEQYNNNLYSISIDTMFDVYASTYFRNDGCSTKDKEPLTYRKRHLRLSTKLENSFSNLDWNYHYNFDKSYIDFKSYNDACIFIDYFERN